MGLGLYENVSQTLRQLVKLQARYEPNWDNHRKYGDIYPIFRSIYEHLRPDFDRAAAVRGGG